MKTIQIILTVVFVFSNNAKAQNPIRIALAQELKKAEQKQISEIVSEIEYIPLETSPECLLDEDVSKIEIFGEHIFISDYKHIFVFEKDGKFICKIAKQGKAPGEYSSQGFMTFLLDKTNKNLTIFDLMSRKMITYDFKGNFLFDRKIDFMPGPAEFVETNNIAVYNMGLTYENTPWTDLYFLNKQAKIVGKHRFNKLEGQKYGLTVFPAIFYKYQGKTRYKNPHENIVWEIDRNNNLNPVYFLDYGIYESSAGEPEFDIKVNKKKEVSVNANPKANEKIGITGLNETDNFLLINYVHQSKKHFGVYDKNKKRFYRVFDNEFNTYGFSDDIKGGIPVNLIKGAGSNFLCSFSHAYNLIDMLEGSPKDAQLRSILNKIDYEDNPVIILLVRNESY